VDYENALTKLRIVCNEHGVFEQRLHDHLKTGGCSYCGGTGKLTTNMFIEKSKGVHGDKYDYSKSKYVNTEDKIKIICKSHGEFLQTPHDHLRGKACAN